MNQGLPPSGNDEPGPPDASFQLKRHEKPGSGVQRIALGRIDKVLEGLGGLSSDEDQARTIHDVRKDLKKLRSVLRMVRKELGGKQYRLQNQLFREVGRELSGNRDAQVKVETLASVTEEHEDARLAARQWLLDLEAERDLAAQEVVDSESTRLEEEISRIEQAKAEVEDWSLDLGPVELIDGGLAVSYRKGRKAMRRVRKDPSPENVHEWRKGAKDLWYQLRIIRKAWPDLIGEMADETHELTEFLGDHHDLSVLAEDLLNRQLPDGDQRTMDLVISQLQEELVMDALGHGGRIYAEKPKDFERRMHRYWRVWRPG